MNLIEMRNGRGRWLSKGGGGEGRRLSCITVCVGGGLS